MRRFLNPARLLLGTLALGVLLVLFAVGIMPAVSRVRALKPASSEESTDESKLCGPRSLWTACRRLGIPVDRKDLEEIPVDPLLGTALGDLRKAAAALGLHAEARELTWEELKALETTAVLFVRGNHFVATDPRETPPADLPQDQVRIYDPDRVAAWWPRPELEAVWQGAALVVHRVPAPAVPGPRAAWQTCWEDRGLMRDVETAQYTFHVSNEGDQPLEMEVATTSCNCSSARLKERKLPPGGSTTLEVEVNLRAKRGAFLEYAVVRSNDPAASLTQLIFGGAVVNPDVVSAWKVHWGAVRPGESGRQRFFVHDPGEGRLEVFEAKWIAAAEGGTEAPAGRARWEKIEAGSPHVGAVGRYAVRPGDYVVDVDVPIPGDYRPGPVVGEVEVKTNLPHKLAQFKVYVEGLVLSDIEASPAALLLNDVGERARARVRLTSLRGRAIAAKEVTVTRGMALAIEEISQPAASVVEFTVRSRGVSAPAVTGEGEVICRLQDGRVVSIPVVVIPRSPST